MVLVELYSQPVFGVHDLLRHEEVAGLVCFCPWLVVFLLHREGAHEGGRWRDGRDDAVPGWLGFEAAGLELAGSDLVDADGAETAECVHCGRAASVAPSGGVSSGAVRRRGLRRVMRAKKKCVGNAGLDVHATWLGIWYIWEQRPALVGKLQARPPERRKCSGFDLDWTGMPGE